MEYAAGGVVEGPHLVVTTRVDDAPEPSLSTLLVAIEAAPTPLERIAAVTALTKALQVVERDSVNEAKSAGSSWSAIAEQLGVTKQAAARRFAPAREAEHEAKPEHAEKAERRTHHRAPTTNIRSGPSGTNRPPRRQTPGAGSRPRRPRLWRPCPAGLWVLMLMVAAAGLVLGKWILPS